MCLNTNSAVLVAKLCPNQDQFTTRNTALLRSLVGHLCVNLGQKNEVTRQRDNWQRKRHTEKAVD